MESGPFFALLRSFAELSPIQLEHAQEHLHDHLQRTRPWPNSRRCDRIVPIVMPPRSSIGGNPMDNSAIAATHVAKHSISYTTPRWPGCATRTNGLTTPIA